MTIRESKLKNENIASFMNNARIQFKIIFGLNWIIAPIFIAVIPLSIFFEQGDNAFKLSWANMVMETFSPLIGIIVGSNAFSKEWDLGTDEVWLTKFRSRYPVFINRVIIMYLYLLLLTFLSLLAIRLFYVKVNLLEGFFIMLPPMFLLSNIGMLAGLLSRNTIIAYLAPSLYWFLEMTTKGRFTGIFYLFPRRTIACMDSCGYRFDWMSCKLAVGLLALILLFILGRLLVELEKIRK